MSTPNPSSTPSSPINPRIFLNQTSVRRLFQRYEEIGFLYPAKKKLLMPHMSSITANWEKLVASREALLWILSNENPQNNEFASISVWKQSNYGLIAQHLVSNGNPFNSLRLMLAAQYRAEHQYDASQVRSSQNWFRPNNRYAFRVFASMFEKLGPERASLLLFQYLHMPVANISPARVPAKWVIAEQTTAEPGLTKFIEQQYGRVFAKAEEVNGDDLGLERLNKAYRRYGLSRTRKIFVIRNRKTSQVIGCAIANRAPLGLNFSFLENRAYYIIDQDLSTADRKAAISLFNNALRPVYADFALGVIPIVTGGDSSALLERMGAKHVREYLQSIWLREGFRQWYAHIQSFLDRIESRKRRAGN